MKMTKDKMKGLISISLLVQAISMLILFLTQIRRRKGLAFAFLGVGVVSAGIAALLGKFEYTDVDDEEEKKSDETASEDDDLDIDSDMLRADLAHGTEDDD